MTDRPTTEPRTDRVARMVWKAIETKLDPDAGTVRFDEHDWQSLLIEEERDEYRAIAARIEAEAAVSAGADPEPRTRICCDDNDESFSVSPCARRNFECCQPWCVHFGARAQGGPSVIDVDGATRGHRCPAIHDVAGWCSRDEGHPGAHESRHPRGRGLGAWWNERYSRGLAPESSTRTGRVKDGLPHKKGCTLDPDHDGWCTSVPTNE